MKLEDQVLSIAQVQELQELGFDVERYASMCWVTYTSDEPPYEKEYSLSILDEFCYESASLEPTPTMSIGDIIDILPHHKFLFEKGYEDTNMYHLEHKFPSLEGIKILQHESGSFLRLLFDNLKWCIINKHIEL